MHAECTHAHQMHGGVCQSEMRTQQTGGLLISPQGSNSRKRGGENGEAGGKWRGGMEIAKSEVIHQFVHKHLLKRHQVPCEPKNLGQTIAQPVLHLNPTYFTYFMTYINSVNLFISPEPDTCVV